MHEWGWKARVLQTSGGGGEGATWEVGASQPPRSSILQCSYGDVVVTHLRSTTRDPKPANVLASAATKRLLTQGVTPSSASADPWHQGHDPWASSSSAASGMRDPAAAERLQQIEHRLQSNLQDTIRKELQQAHQQMDGQDDDFKEQTNQRFAKLEAGITELQSQHVKFEGWFAQMNQTDQFLAAQVEQTQQRIDQVHQNVNTQIASLQENVSQVRNEVSAGFSNIEAMLSKRGKTS